MNRFHNIWFGLLFAAALMLILNRAIPHHHHEDQVCYADTKHTCEDADHADEDGHHEDAEHENNHSDSELCPQYELFLAPNNKVSSIKTRVSNDHKLYTLTLFMHDWELQLPFLVKRMLYILVKDRNKLPVLSLNRALRGPPAV
jgi:hypothetical protein